MKELLLEEEKIQQLEKQFLRQILLLQRYIKQYSKPGAMRAGFEYYRAVFEDAKQNKEYGKK